MRISDWSSDVCSSDRRPASEPVELALQVAEFRDLAGHGGGLGVQQIEDVGTWDPAIVSDADHLTDLGQAEACSLRRCDEPQSVERAVVVVAVAARRTGGDRQSVVWGKSGSGRV